MAKFVIEGSNTLRGELPVSGAKNAALKVIAAAILLQGECLAENVPEIEDIERMFDIFRAVGGKVQKEGPHAFRLSGSSVHASDLPHELVERLRASIMFAGPMLARFGHVKLAHPGGCLIGQRPIDIFLDGFRALGAEVREHANAYDLRARSLRGAHYVFRRMSVTATEALMMTATQAEGVTVLENAAMEPEIPSLADFLNACGADISGAGTPTIRIRGQTRLSGGRYVCLPDRIEAGTFALLAAASGSELTITNCRPEHLSALFSALRLVGVSFDIRQDSVIIKPSGTPRASDIVTREYPGFPTDLQPPYTVLMTQAEGISLVHETIHDGRLFYTDVLRQMGARIIMCDPHRVIVHGPTKLGGRKITSPDLRAGIALLIASLVAEGSSTIENIYQIDRGYEKIEERLQSIGANIRRVE